MFKMNHIKLVTLSGLFWLGVGLFLLPLGLSLLTGDAQNGGSYRPLLDFIAPFFGGTEPATVVIIALSLFLGYFKGRFALGRSVSRLVNRIKMLPDPAYVYQIYPIPYYFLLGSMIGLGMAIKYFNCPVDIRGAVDVTIGSALINGAMIYFRHAFVLRENYL